MRHRIIAPETFRMERGDELKGHHGNGSMTSNNNLEAQKNVSGTLCVGELIPGNLLECPLPDCVQYASCISGLKEGCNSIPFSEHLKDLV